MAEGIQQFILNTLESQGKIQDTRTLVLPGKSDAAATQDAQIAILGALNSLLSREVCNLRSEVEVFSMFFSVDGHDRLPRDAVSCINSRRRTDRS